MKKVSFILLILVVAALSASCSSGNKDKKVKIGVSIAVLNAERWEKDVAKMQETADELGVELVVTMSHATPEQQYDECKALIEQDIDVLIVTPRDAHQASEIVKLAHSKNVKVISYDRIILYEPVDLVVTFDSYKVGEMQGKYLVELVDKGNYVVLAGDEKDYNSSLFLNGAMSYIQPLADAGDINIVSKEYVEGWSPDNAKAIMQEALKENGNNIQAVLAPNDKLAGGCIQALAEVGLAGKVPVTGMDADISAVKRILNGKTQDVTIFKDIRVLAKTAIEQAVKLGKGEKIDDNATLDTFCQSPVISVFVEPQLVTEKNIDRVLIESKYFTKEEVYGE